MVDRGQNECLHPAVSDLMAVLSKANNDLTDVQHRLQIDFQQSYPDHVSVASYFCYFIIFNSQQFTISFLWRTGKSMQASSSG